MIIFEELSWEGIIGACGGSTLFVAITAIILEILKVWKQCREDKKTGKETLLIVLKHFTPKKQKAKNKKKVKK